jgi:hypothetical protein
MTSRLLSLSVACAVLVSCGAGTAREKARSYALDNLACSGDADCCVVFDGCVSEGLIVLATDRAKVTDLLQAAPKDVCTDCMNPPVQARCEKGVCAGKLVQEGSSCDWSGLQPFVADHCGAIAVPTGCAEITPTRGSSLRINCGGTAN